MIHLVLDFSGLVLAHFLSAEDAADYARQPGRTHLPFNLSNRDHAPAPLVGTHYHP